jgi:hypothetical protein
VVPFVQFFHRPLEQSGLEAVRRFEGSRVTHRWADICRRNREWKSMLANRPSSL